MPLKGSCRLLAIVVLTSLPALAQNSATPASPSAAQSGQPSPESGQSPASSPAPKTSPAPSASDSSQAPSDQSADQQKASATAEPDLQKHAWEVLKAGVADKSPLKRAAALKAIALIKGQSWATSKAVEALDDKNVDVRSAGALALGELQATSTIPKLKNALSDK